MLFSSVEYLSLCFSVDLSCKIYWIDKCCNKGKQVYFLIFQEYKWTQKNVKIPSITYYNIRPSISLSQLSIGEISLNNKVKKQNKILLIFYMY